jgi:uncharacterized RDD family membrane protein YckC
MPACPTCGTEVLAGSRWCSICHTNILKPEIGRLASPGRRLGAYFLDFIVPIAIGLFAFGIGVSGERASRGMGSSVAALLLIGYIVWAVVLFFQGTTPGKRALRMYVVKEDGRRAGFGTMLLREWIGKWISGLVFGLGYLWILLDKDRQAWHDKLASTYVVERQGG